MKHPWKLEGYDEFSGEEYPLPGDFPDRESALSAADAKFREIERTQSSESSGGQSREGIQDRIFLIAPDGSKERLWPGRSGI